MKKNLFSCILFFLLAVVVFAQSEESQDITAQSLLKEISVSKMEDSGYWYGAFSPDYGYISLRDFEGGSDDKEAIEEEEEVSSNSPDENVIGAKVGFYRRGVTSFTVQPIRPISIEGITKTVSVWVAGRNTKHELELLVTDHFGNNASIPMGKLNFYGWKKLTVTIPQSIKQREAYNVNRVGLALNGFRINCNIDETYGRYYIYFDDIRAVTDLFAEEILIADDMSDGW